MSKRCPRQSPRKTLLGSSMSGLNNPAKRRSNRKEITSATTRSSCLSKRGTRLSWSSWSQWAQWIRKANYLNLFKSLSSQCNNMPLGSQGLLMLSLSLPRTSTMPLLRSLVMTTLKIIVCSRHQRRERRRSQSRLLVQVCRRDHLLSNQSHTKRTLEANVVNLRVNPLCRADLNQLTQKRRANLHLLVPHPQVLVVAVLHPLLHLRNQVLQAASNQNAY